MNLRIVNTSDQPVMSVLVAAGVRRDIWHDAGAADGKDLEERGVEWSAVAIAPDDDLNVRLDLTVPASVATIVADYGDVALIGELLFTDAAGVDWVRTHDGHLLDRRSADWVNTIHLSLGQRDELRRKQEWDKLTRKR
jgi:hypothetical protein